MELCTVRGISNLSSLNPKHFSPTDIQFKSFLLRQTNVPFLHKQTRFNIGLQYHRNSCLRSTASDEISADAAPYVKDEPKSDSAITVDDTLPFDKKEDYGSQLNEAPQEGSLTDDPLQLFKFMEDLNLKAIADVEKAVVESLEKQYSEILSPLKENTPIKFGLKYVQKFAKGNGGPYNVSAELGVVLNSMKRMLDTLRPQIEAQLKSWGSCIPETGNMVPGECLSEVTVMIRSKFRAYVQAVIDKLVENTKLHNATKLKKIVQDSKENLVESDLRRRMQPLKELLSGTINQLHAVFETQVFVIVCRGFWDRMGQDMLKFLEDRKENRAWYKASRVAVSVLDDTFASQMQQLLGNALQEKDVEPPRCIMEVRSMLCKDAVNHKDNNYYF